MAVLLAYILVVLIWATTPLAIKLSSDSISFIAAVVLRMTLALSLALTFTLCLRRQLFPQPGIWKVYFAASIGVFPNMPVVYWSAQYIPSGLIAVIFSMSPFVTGVMSLLILKENPFSRRRILALLVALGGLLIIFQDQLQIDHYAAYGIAGILLSCFLFSLSSVWLKSLNENADAFSQTTGSLLFAWPGLLLSWWWLDGSLPRAMPAQAMGAVAYLAIFGSLLGSTVFFYVLKRLSPSIVSLITLITPVLALLIGAFIAGERLSGQLILGAALVITSLLFYINVPLFSLLKQGRWFERCMQRGAIAHPVADIKDDYIRYK